MHLIQQEQDREYLNLTSTLSGAQNDYQYNLGYISRRILFQHVIQTLTQVRQKIQKDSKKLVKNYQSTKIGYQDLPNICENDEAIHITKQGFSALKQIIKNKDQAKNLTSLLIFKMITQQYTSHIAFIIFLFTIEMVCKLGFSVWFQQLFHSISNNNIIHSYYYAMVCGIVWFIGHISRHNGYYEVTYFSGRIKNQLVFMLYLKLSKTSQFTVKSQQIGKIINLLSSDLGALQSKLSVAFKAMTAPIAIIGICIILLSRFGWPGLLIVLIIFLVFCIQVIIGKFNSKTIKQINVEKDKRVKLCIQIIECIKFIKLYTLQQTYKRTIQTIRENQIIKYVRLAFGKSLEKSMSKVSTLFATFICFLMVDLKDFGYNLDNAKIFSTLQLMVTTKVLIMCMGTTISFCYQFQIILQRFCSIFNIQDKRMTQIDQETKQLISQQKVQYQKLNVGQIVMDKLTVYLQNKNITTYAQPILKNIDLLAKKGQFIGIAGKVGSGKSALFMALLEEAPYYSGKINKKGTIAYVQQQPVIFYGTIKENILFGLQFCQQKYKKCLEMSCLAEDLQIFPLKDQTKVGEKGILLSGGQKARLSLARSLYFDADIYLFDDPISAVDSKVAKQIYQNVILKLKGIKTILLITHQLSYLQNCDQIIILEKGQIIDKGTPQSLQHRLNNKQILIESNNKLTDKQLKFPEKYEAKQIQIQRTDINQKQQDALLIKQQRKQIYSIPKQNQQIITGFRSYTKYLFYTKNSYILLPIYVLLLCITEAAFVIYYKLLSQYDNIQNSPSQATFNNTLNLWLALGGLLAIYFVLGFFKFLILNLLVLHLNKTIHQDMINGIIYSPVSYFDITPTSDLKNKFSNDLGNMDNQLFQVLCDSIEGPLFSLILIVNIFSISLYYIIPCLISIFILVFMFFYSKKAIAELRNLDIRLKNPVFQMVGEMINGLIQMKIFNRRFFLLNEFAKKLNNSFRANITNCNLSRAFGVCTNYSTSLLIWIGWIIGLSFTKPETVGLYQVSIVFLIDISDYMQWYLRQMITFQSLIVSVERVLQVANLPSQIYKKQRNMINDNRQDIQKQTNSHRSLSKDNQLIHIKFDNFSMRYRQQLPLVLKDISFQIAAKQRVAIVGRTGAGKSSIVQAIFRLYEPQNGSIYQIGGQNSLAMDLYKLRKNISVIPQAPFLIKDTIKKNLNPFQTKSDKEIWEALSWSNLDHVVQKLPEKLNTIISNASEIFSVGQKQLFCLARAILSQNKILVLDEATSNVDMNSDSIIQKCIKEKFRSYTVITIAHRLDTIADYDRIIVMEQGRIVQTGTPFQLLQMGGKFTEMVNSYKSNLLAIQNKYREKEIV